MIRKFKIRDPDSDAKYYARGDGFLISNWTGMCHADFEISTFSIPGKMWFSTRHFFIYHFFRKKKKKKNLPKSRCFLGPSSKKKKKKKKKKKEKHQFSSNWAHCSVVIFAFRNTLRHQRVTRRGQISNFRLTLSF